jgi:hypothetical protein
MGKDGSGNKRDSGHEPNCTTTIINYQKLFIRAYYIEYLLRFISKIFEVNILEEKIILNFLFYNNTA